MSEHLSRWQQSTVNTLEAAQVTAEAAEQAAASQGGDEPAGREAVWGILGLGNKSGVGGKFANGGEKHLWTDLQELSPARRTEFISACTTYAARARAAEGQ